MKRRNFIRSTALGIPLFVNGLKLSAITGRNNFLSLLNGSNKVLVLIELNGGNDGLNTLIPKDQYDKLALLRPNVIVPESSILDVDDVRGFHPVFQGMHDLFSEGKLNIIQDVGYTNQNRSHFRSLDIWNTGSSYNEFATRGWIGNYLDTIHQGFPDNYPNSDCPDPIAISMGFLTCLLYTSPSPRDQRGSRMPSSA